MHRQEEHLQEASNCATRYEGLDQLRGILAFCVMIYHYAEWHGIILPWPAQKPFELLGIYAVSTFYVLSGCALFIVYQRRKIDNKFFSEFWIKRAFRIVPLFWLATLLVVLTQKEATQEWSQYLNASRLFLNFSLLFSWFDPSAYLATGAWSIGNEWAFYTLFPFILWAVRRRSTATVLCVITCAITAWFSFFVMNSGSSLKDQWQSYVHPMNQLILFVCGVLLGPWVLKARARELLPTRVLVAVILFVAISYSFSVPSCVSGCVRFVLVGLCVVCCDGFKNPNFPWLNLLHSLPDAPDRSSWSKQGVR
jgi:exopolysaccharide production protein ExoZ